jgi:hypothetical protein
MKLMDDTPDQALWYALYRLETSYWWEVDLNDGRNAYAFYLPDGLYAVGDNRFVGHDKLRAFYNWRARRGQMTARHIVSNFQVTASDDTHARLLAVLSLYRSNGRPPILGSYPPCLIADVTGDCERDEDGMWRYRSHVVRPIFVGSDIPLSLSIDTDILEERDRELADRPA